MSSSGGRVVRVIRAKVAGGFSPRPCTSEYYGCNKVYACVQCGDVFEFKPTNIHIPKCQVFWTPQRLKVSPLNDE